MISKAALMYTVSRLIIGRNAFLVSRKYELINYSVKVVEGNLDLIGSIQ